MRFNYPKEKKGEVEYHKKTHIPKIKRENFGWKPQKTVERFDYPWFTEPLNFSWIISDAVYSKCNKPMPASILDLDKSFKKKDTSTFQPRFMY